MFYVVCNNCESYFELKKDESIEHLNLKCECGGNFISVDTENNNLNFSNVKNDYNKFIDYLKNNKINFNSEWEVPIFLDKDETILLNFENIKLVSLLHNQGNATLPNNSKIIDEGTLTLTNKKIIFLGSTTLNFDLCEIKTVKSFYNGFGIVLNNEFELKNYFVGIDQIRIKLPLKAIHDRYTTPFNGEMAKIMIENTIKNYKNSLKFSSKDDDGDNHENFTKNEDIHSTNLMDCPDCGHKISTQAKKCPNCGRPITYKDIPNTGSTELMRERTKIVIFGTIFTIIGIIISVLFNLGYFTWIIAGLIGMYIGWNRKDIYFEDSLKHALWVSCLIGLPVGIFFLFVAGTFVFILAIPLLIMIMLLPGLIIGRIISEFINPKKIIQSI